MGFNCFNMFPEKKGGKKFLIILKEAVLCIPEENYDPVKHVFHININPYKDFIIHENEVEKFTLFGR